MLSGMGIVITLIGMLSQRRVQRVVSRIKSKTKVQPWLLGDEIKIKTDIKNKVKGIEMLTYEDFDTLIIMIKSQRRTLLEESKILYKYSGYGNVYYSKPKFWSNCGLNLT
jgi:hypothetical protein